MSQAVEAASLIRRGVEKSGGSPLSLWKVSSVEASTGKVALRKAEAAVEGSELHARVIGFMVAPGDLVLVARIEGGALIVVGKVSGSLPSEVEVEAPLRVPSGEEAPLYRESSQTAADTPSTTSTTTMQVAISLGIPLGSGSWALRVRGQGNFSHSAGATMSWCLEVDGVEVSTRNVTLATTRETYVNDAAVGGIAGGRTVTCKVKYRSSGAGTTACRAPDIQIWAERE